MKYIAVMIAGRNTFVNPPLENDNDPREEVEQDAERIADRLGVSFIYLEDVEE